MQTIPTRTCGKCHQVKPLTAFGTYRKSPDGRRWECKQCRSGIANGVKCPACNFRGRSPRAISTHWAHAHKGPYPLTTTERQCKHCARPFIISNAQLAVRSSDYCSRECWKEGVATEAHATCEHCGSKYVATDSYAARTRKYCSKACADAGAVGRVVSRQAVTCEQCGAPFEEIQYRLDRGRRFCSHACASRARDEGKTSLEERFRSGEKARGWREAVLARDDYSCQACGIRQPAAGHGPHHHVHHVVPVSHLVANLDGDADYTSHPLFANVDNGLTLCMACHQAEHGKESNVHRPARPDPVRGQART